VIHTIHSSPWWSSGWMPGRPQLQRLLIGSHGFALWNGRENL
jgi:hypothetical protein